MKREFAAIFVAAAAIFLSACTTEAAPASGLPRASPPPVTPEPAREAAELAVMPVWTVPAGAFRVHEAGVVQVRLSANVDLDEALLTATSSDPALAIEPQSGIPIRNLRPATPRPAQAREPGEPPALGITFLASFKAVAAAPGDYKVRVRLEFRGKVQSQDVIVHAQ